VVDLSGQYGRKPPYRSWDEAIGELASRHYGVVSLAQLLELGLSRAAVEARLKRKRMVALHRGVYAVGHTALTIESHFIAAVYACGPGALLSYRCAGAVPGLLRWSPQTIDVTVAGERKARKGITVHRSRALGEADRTVVDGIPTTSVARTIVDLADVLTEERLAKLIGRAEVLRVFDLRALERAWVAGRRGEHRLGRVLAAYQPEPHLLRSKAERRLKQLCAQHHLPQPQFNVQVAGYEVDVYWPDAGFVVEFDGARTHQTIHAFHDDRRRDRALATQGIQVARVTWPDLGPSLMEEVRAILRRR
jgi:very-short-patch-repair endonuclease